MTIAMSVTLLILLSITVFTVHGSITTETRVINTGLRSQQAFEAAEGGLTAAIDYLNNDWDRDDDGNVDPVYDTDADGIGDSNTANVGDGKALITTTLVSADPPITIQLTSQGFSDDATANRTVSQVVSVPDPLPKLPDNPLSARTNVTILGSATIVNPEGNTNIWSGGDVDLGSNNSTATEIADPQDPDYPECMQTALTCNTIRSSNKVNEGSDIVEKDANLKNRPDNELFEFYFGLTPSTYRDYVVSLETTGASANADVQYATEEIIWIEGDVDLANTTTIGCGTSPSSGGVCPAGQLKPSVLIINGDATFSGPTIFGLVYVTGNISVTSSTDVQGAMIVTGTLTNTTSGSLDIVYNSAVLQSVRRSGNMLPAAGTWKDFL